jgi:hypothetical protein
LKLVTNPGPNLVDALRRFLRRNPRRCDEQPSWFAVALWAEDYVADKPTLVAVEVALAELHREAA